jgi:hypothetical protein
MGVQSDGPDHHNIYVASDMAEVIAIMFIHLDGEECVGRLFVWAS